jgi:hypothetical protein
MPTVSESLARLSASMAGLPQRAKEAEDQIAAARKETREELEARVAGAKATAQRRRVEIKTRGTTVKDELASAWASLLGQVQEQFEKMQARLEEKRDDFDAKAASGGLSGPRPMPPTRWTSPGMLSTKPRRRPSRPPRPGRSPIPSTRAPRRRQARSDVPDRLVAERAVGWLGPAAVSSLEADAKPRPSG